MSTATRPLADLPTITMDLAALLTYQPDVPTLDHVTHTGDMVPNPLNLPIQRQIPAPDNATGELLGVERGGGADRGARCGRGARRWQ